MCNHWFVKRIHQPRILYSFSIKFIGKKGLIYFK